MIRSQVLICGGTGCTSSGSKQLQETFKEQLAANGLAEEVKIIQTGCFGLCALGPVVVVYPEGVFYSQVKVEDVPVIVTEHLLKGRVVQRLVYDDIPDDVREKAAASGKTASLSDTAFYRAQKRVALRNCGVINPENIEEYIAMDGYASEKEQKMLKLLQTVERLNIALLVTAGVLRSVEARGGIKKPCLCDIENEACLEKYASLVMFLYRPEYYCIYDDYYGSTLNKADVIIARNRRGNTGEIRLEFANKASFEELSHDEISHMSNPASNGNLFI